MRAHLAADALTYVLPTLRLDDGAGRRLSRATSLGLVYRLGTVGGNPARPEGALEWSARAAERQGEIGEQLLRAQAETGGEASPDRRTRDLERLAADLGAVRPALDALVAIARGALEGTSLSTLWPLLRAFLDEWLLQPPDGPRVHLMLDEPLGNLAADGTCGSLAGDDTLRIVEDAILAARVPAGRFGEPAVYVGLRGDHPQLRGSALAAAAGRSVTQSLLRDRRGRRGAGPRDVRSPVPRGRERYACPGARRRRGRRPRRRGYRDRSATRSRQACGRSSMRPSGRSATVSTRS